MFTIENWIYNIILMVSTFSAKKKLDIISKDLVFIILTDTINIIAACYVSLFIWM